MLESDFNDSEYGLSVKQESWFFYLILKIYRIILTLVFVSHLIINSIFISCDNRPP